MLITLMILNNDIFSNNIYTKIIVETTVEITSIPYIRKYEQIINEICNISHYSCPHIWCSC